MKAPKTSSLETPAATVRDESPLLELLAAARPDIAVQLRDVFRTQLGERDTAIFAEFRAHRATIDGQLRERDAALDLARAEIGSLRSRLEALDSVVADLRAPPKTAEAPARISAEVRVADTSSPLAAGTPVVAPKSGYRTLYAPAGVFTMGGTDRVVSGADEFPTHEVTLTRAFLIGEAPVTQGLLCQVLPEWGSAASNLPSWQRAAYSALPATQVSWLWACSFANQLSALEGYEPAYQISGSTVHWRQSASGFRLPTEAEWEYAARAGSKTIFAGSNDAETVAWTAENASSRLREARTKSPNAWGMHDMSGNVFEWCWDWYHTYPAGPAVDPVGPQEGTSRVRRGGSFTHGRSCATVGFRGSMIPMASPIETGFRLVRWAD